MLVLAPQLMDQLEKAMSQQLAFNAATVMAPGTMLNRLQTMVIVGLIASTVFAALTSSAARVREASFLDMMRLSPLLRLLSRAARERQIEPTNVR